jgi:hypothetical protein
MDGTYVIEIPGADAAELSSGAEVFEVVVNVLFERGEVELRYGMGVGDLGEIVDNALLLHVRGLLYVRPARMTVENEDEAARLEIAENAGRRDMLRLYDSCQKTVVYD